MFRTDNLTPAGSERRLERKLAAQRLAQYISRNRCERYLRLAIFPSDATPLRERYGVGFDALSPLLFEEGASFEREKIDELVARGESVIDLTNKPASEFFDALRKQNAPRAYYYQASLEGKIGLWACGGRADLIEATRTPDGAYRFTVIDIKASARETVGYRLQVAFYVVLLREQMRVEGLPVGEIEGAIAARETAFAAGEWSVFDLTLFVDEIERLIAAPDSDVARAARVSFEAAQYHLGAHCDGCPYNAICFINAAEREDLSLVPHLTVTEKRALQNQAIETSRDLARLMEYDAKGIAVAPESAEVFARIGKHWALHNRLPILAQRARAALNRRDKSIEHRRALYGGDWGSLPCESQYPDLIKVFIDTQRDYIQDRLYLVAALVVGPKGTRQIIEMTEAIPDTENEGRLLIQSLQQLLPSIAQVADSTDAPLHLYLFDRRGQSRLLEALTRHFEELCALPAFYDLLTSTPALTQGMISFLGDEVCERQNLGAICTNLYEVAQAMNFKWRDGAINLPQRFRSGVFDNRRRYVREEHSKQFARPAGAAKAEGELWVESAARFGTEIPLEYAYAAWEQLPQTAETEQAQLHNFQGTTRADLIELASARLAALRHIEESFHYKNRRIEKLPLALEKLDQVELDPATVPLSRALEDFLYLEHHARMQSLLLHFALPPAQRTDTGRTAIMRCDGYDKERRQATFTLTDETGEELPAIQAGGALRVREGDWMTLNALRDGETEEPPAGKRIVHGRLSVVEEITENQLRLRLQPLSFKNSRFRFGHRMIEPEQGLLYTLDEMADDLNADKLLAACRNASSNHLYQWLDQPQLGQTPRAVRPTRLRAAKRVAEIAHAIQTPFGLTNAQRKVIGEFVADRVLVLQGPPGTGKSHTLGFATLARALSQKSDARPFRIAVCAKTHAAVQIALGSIRARADNLLRGSENLSSEDVALLQTLAPLQVWKICNDESESLPDGVECLLADGNQRMKAGEQWAHLMGEPLVCIGGTPGGFYNLVKRGASKGKGIDWSNKYFDLVLVDEASQMGQAEALLAAAFLREDGQFIAIGDHRQMPPILVHAWDQDSRRELEHVRPHLSIFESLRELEFANTALDESFRIPEEVADFLGRHVYAADGIQFHSQNRNQLPPLSEDSNVPAWIKAALEPEHPLVLIEHEEAGSQQANEYEAAIIAELAKVASEHLGLKAKDGLGIVVPHRAQKALLRARLPEYAEAIDTVERFQGSERDLIIVSATVSDREYASAESEFLLEPRRFTVAISRPKRKVIVVASRSVFDLVPPDLDAYERGSLWKSLRHEVEHRVLWHGEIKGHAVSVRVV